MDIPFLSVYIKDTENNIGGIRMVVIKSIWLILVATTAAGCILAGTKDDEDYSGIKNN